MSVVRERFSSALLPIPDKHGVRPNEVSFVRRCVLNPRTRFRSCYGSF